MACVAGTCWIEFLTRPLSLSVEEPRMGGGEPVSAPTQTGVGCIARNLDRPEVEVTAMRSQGLILLAMHLTWNGRDFTVEDIGDRMAVIQELPDGTLWVSTGASEGHYTVRRFSADSWRSSPSGPAMTTHPDIGVAQALELIG
jgi:hypothetical protein